MSLKVGELNPKVAVAYYATSALSAFVTYMTVSDSLEIVGETLATSLTNNISVST